MSQISPVEQTGKRLIFEDSIMVPASLEEVYRRWSDFTSFPDFMSNVEEVIRTGDGQYHWVARIFGVKTEWDAEITDQEPNRRIAWRSTSGAYNAGTVTFHPLSGDNTEVHLRLEYTPPGGRAGQALDSITRTTRREVHEDLSNFRRLMKGEHLIDERPSESEQLGEGPGRVALSLLPAVAGAALGGIMAYYTERNRRRAFSMETVRGAMQNPRAFVSTQRDTLGRYTTRYTAPVRAAVAEPWPALGWVFGGLSLASMLGSAGMRLAGRKNDSLFVGQWAPSLLGAGIFSRLLGSRRGPSRTGAVTSWTFFGAALGALLTSAIWRLTGRRKESLFVGQWTPTLLGAAIFARLLRR